MAAEKLSRRERERERHRELILHAAERLFAEKGFYRTTMQEIAQRAEFALGTVYRFFRGKQELYEQLLERKLQELVATVCDQMAQEQSPLGRVRKFIEAKLTFLAGNAHFARLFFAEAHAWRSSVSQRLERKLRDKYNDLLDKLSGTFEEGMGQGIFAQTDPRLLALALDGLTSALALRWAEWREQSSDVSPASEIEAAKRLFLQGVLARPQTM